VGGCFLAWGLAGNVHSAETDLAGIWQGLSYSVLRIMFAGMAIAKQDEAKELSLLKRTSSDDEQPQPLIAVFNETYQLLTGYDLIVFGDRSKLIPEIGGESCQKFGKIF
jgi:hypothetical protein